MILKGNQTTSSPPRLHIHIPLNPIPASRPRVTRWGVYYGKKYTAWRKDVEKHFKSNPLVLEEIFTGPVLATINHVLIKPPTSKLHYPNPDLDNFDKAVMDAITSHTQVWNDDKQVVRLRTGKNFQSDEHPTYGAHITIEDYKT